jgi:hypothetical protein
MVERLTRLLAILLAAGAAPLAVSSCELLAGVHDVELVEAPDAHAPGDADGAGDAGPCGVHQGTTYYVDPLGGNDATANGSMACSFRTITAALQHLGATPAAGTTVVVANTAQVAPPVETFPIVVPANVLIQGQETVVNTSTVTSPAFVLAAQASGLDGLIIDGSQHIDGGMVSGGNTGIDVRPGGDATITDVHVQWMSQQGIVVELGGVLTLGSGVSSMSNGVPVAADAGSPWPGDGLVVYGSATIVVDSGGTTVELDNNAHYGIWVRDMGSLVVKGSHATVVHAQGNYHGLTINQTPPPPDAGAAPLNDISRLFVEASVGHGITISGGSSLKLRSSRSRSSGGSGIHITNAEGSSDVSNIDLGRVGDFGGNTFQYTPPDGNNAVSGICLYVDAHAHQTLNAAGNVFDGADCASTPASLDAAVGIKDCVAGSDYSIGPGPVTTNHIDVSECH